MGEEPDRFREATIFAGLRPETVDFLFARSRALEFRPGEHLLREREAGGDLYVLRSGRVEVYLERLKAGEASPLRVRLAELGAGDCLGETSLLGILPRTASVLALTDCSCVRIGNADLLALCDRDAREFALLVMNLGRELARRLWRMNDLLLERLLE